MSRIGRGRARIREDAFVLDIGEKALPLVVRRHPAAKRLTLRVDPDGPRAIVTIPGGLDPMEGFDMAARRRGWIAARLGTMAERIPFDDGTTVPIGGEPVVIRHCPSARRGVWLEDGCLYVSGEAAHMSRRIRDWLRAEASRRLREAVEEKAALLGRPFGRISVRDTKSRWGSCSARGDLSFCWRLILAPPHVLEYVAAHEVAHLAEHNHGPRFWKQVAALTPVADSARAWLKREGGNLRRYG